MRVKRHGNHLYGVFKTLLKIVKWEPMFLHIYLSPNLDMPRNWSEAEIEAILERLLRRCSMLELEGRRYNKTEHRLALMDTISTVPKGSIERKHMNISAVLERFGFPYIYGYKPYSNVQHALFDAVRARLK